MSLIAATGACDPPRLDSRVHSIEGEPARGRELALAYGCTTCHRIPGIRAPTGNLGPSLHGLAQRGYLAGRLPNDPENMIRWIMDPPAIDPLTVMPNLGVTLVEAHHLVAYLYETD